MTADGFIGEIDLGEGRGLKSKSEPVHDKFLNKFSQFDSSNSMRIAL